MRRNIKIIRSAVGSMPSWGLIGELQRVGVEVVGIDASSFSFGLYRLESSYVVPRADNPGFIEEILKIIKKERPDAILSGPEEELLALSKNKKVIEKEGTLVLCPDYESVSVCADKEKTDEAFRSIGVPTPKVFSDIGSVRFPCIVKPKFGRGSTNVYEVKSDEDLHPCLKKVDKPIIQEFVQGEEYTVDVLADKEGNALSVIPRLRLGIESGISVKGKTVYDEEIIDYSRRIVKELKIFGPSCIQCIKNKEGVKFIEANTRFGGGSILGIKADPTIIPNLLKLVKGEEPVPSSGFKEGLVMLRYYSEVFISEGEFKEG